MEIYENQKHDVSFDMPGKTCVQTQERPSGPKLVSDLLYKHFILRPPYSTAGSDLIEFAAGTHETGSAFVGERVLQFSGSCNFPFLRAYTMLKLPFTHISMWSHIFI